MKIFTCLFLSNVDTTAGIRGGDLLYLLPQFKTVVPLPRPKKCRQLLQELFDKIAQDGFKLPLPVWLFVQNRLDRSRRVLRNDRKKPSAQAPNPD